MKGRPVTLRRQTSARPPAFDDVTVQAFFHAFQSERITEGLKQGDRLAEILNDEIAAASWPGPPKAGDAIMVDGASLQVLPGVAILYDGTTPLGFSIPVRG